MCVCVCVCVCVSDLCLVSVFDFCVMFFGGETPKSLRFCVSRFSFQSATTLFGGRRWSRACPTRLCSCLGPTSRSSLARFIKEISLINNTLSCVCVLTLYETFQVL